MQFNSYGFIFYFLPLTVLLYFLANKIRPVCGKFVLIAASVLFYAFGRPNMLVCLAISVAVNYFFALLIYRKNVKAKIILSIPVIVNVALLLYFKYTNFILGSACHALGREFVPLNIILPLGISFYTFQQIAYVVSVSRGELDNVSFIDYITYILYFPKLLMGPLMEPVDFMAQINDASRKKAGLNNIVCGIKIFSFGLIKKVLLADTFSRAVSCAYGNVESISAADGLLMVLFYTFEIYFDFSGYSDMAVGASMMLNIDLPINFDSPYKAISIRDFWKRWHISLTSFFTKYIYIPLGGSRKGKIFTYLNVMIVFLVSGLWHGANWTFLLWGLLHGILSCLDRLFEKAEEKVFLPVRWFCTFVLVSFLWLLFSADSVAQWIAIIKNILVMKNTVISDELLNVFNIPETQYIYHMLGLESLAGEVRGLNMFLFTLAAFVICLIPENNYRRKNKISMASAVFAAIFFVWGVLCLGTESVFVYFGF